MKKPLIIFGAGQIAEVAHFYFTHDSDYKVAAFTVDDAYINEDTFYQLPVIPFSQIEKVYPGSQYDMFIALSYQNLNQVREQKYHAAKEKGYHLANYISSKATIWPDLTTNDNCFILEDNTIQPFAKIGNNVTLWSGNHIGHHSVIHDHCFISSHVVVSGGVIIENNCFIGVNAAIKNQTRVGKHSIIGMGAIISNNTEDNSIYKGNASLPSKLKSDQIKL